MRHPLATAPEGSWTTPRRPSEEAAPGNVAPGRLPLVVLSHGGTLVVGLDPALRSLGWSTVVCSALPGPALLTPRWRLLVVADDCGRMPDLNAGPYRYGSCVVVGRRCSVPPVIRVVQWGATDVVDGDQPFTRLVASVHRALLRPDLAPDRTRLLGVLRRHLEEAHRLESLTPREHEVLDAIGHGMSAAEIARGEYVSLPTVRSHVRAILRKLGVGSQLAAVAMVHRVAPEVVVGPIEELHQL